MDDYSRFLKVYANLPMKIRDEIAVVVDGEPYTWKAAYVEIKNETKLGKSMYEKMIATEVI